MPPLAPAFAALLPSRSGVRSFIEAMAGIFSGVFCMDSAVAGTLVMALVLAAAGWIQPTVALGGLLALAGSRVLERVAGASRELRVDINCLLLGLGVGHMFGLGGSDGWLVFAVLTLSGTVFVFVLARTLLVASTAACLPVLSLPFAVGLILLQAAAPALGGVYSHAHEPAAALWPAFNNALPAVLAAFFHDLGAVLFLPDATVGAGLFVIILWQSRLLALHGFLAYIMGVWVLGLWLGNPQAALAHPAGFNFLLTGFALGAFFLLPSWGSWLFSWLGVGVCVLLVVAIERITGTFHATPSTLPFNLAVIGVLALLRRIHSPLIPLRHRRTPEETLDAELCRRRRFGSGVALALPFAGTCRVYQAFDGPWTHQGPWRHAYDFVCCGADGLSYRNSGQALADYHLFGLEVLAPAAGVVVGCRDDLADNPPGQIDHVNNWGNFIIVRMANGLHVELSHLQQHSLRVKAGDLVQIGQPLARAGNSGYSLYPHLHLQVQTGPWLGDETVPFTFQHAIYRGRLHTACLPPVGADVTHPAWSTQPSPMALTLGEVLEFDWDDGAGKPTLERFVVRRTRDAWGVFFLEDAAGNTLKFMVDSAGYTALDYAGSGRSALAFLAAAMPCLPHLASGGRYRDHVPAFLVRGVLHRHMLLLASAFGWPERELGLPCCGTWRRNADGARIRGRVVGCPPVTIHFSDGRLEAVHSKHRTLQRRIPCPA